nr:sugar phosphate isomerase/epimerase family protein [uncultured Oscillibacter sp.]
MKLAIAIASEKAAPSAFVVWRGFGPAIEKAKRAGFQGVELALRSEREFESEGLAEILQRNKMSVSCVSTGQVFAADGLYFTHEDPAVRKRTVEIFQGLIRVAGRLGAMVNIGRARGLLTPERTREETEALFLDSLSQLIPEMERCHVDVVIEPVNRYEINYLNNTDEVCALLRKLHHPRFGVMPDVFHMNIEDDDICESLKRNREYIKYVHLADSNRYYPGRGHLNFEKILGTLRTVGYQGWCAVEILPDPDPDTAAFSAAEALLPFFSVE